MMTNLWAAIGKVGSFIAGLLVGLAIVFAAFGMTDMESGAWQAVLIFGAPAILVLGPALHVLVKVPRRIGGVRSGMALSIA
jgi:hypothetical protein